MQLCDDCKICKLSTFSLLSSVAVPSLFSGGDCVKVRITWSTIRLPAALFNT